MYRKQKNPFHIIKPTPLNKFIGRREIIDIMTNNFLSGEDGSYGIVGGHQIGKSSILNALEDILFSHLEQAGIDDVHTIPLRISLQATSFNEPSDVFGFILHLLRREIYKPKKSMPLLRDYLLESGIIEYKRINPTPATLQDLEHFIDQIITIASPQFGSVLIVLLIDNIDKLLDFSWTSILFGNLRSLISDGIVKESVRLVMAGSERYIEVDEKGSPLMEGLIPLFIGPLLEDDIWDLIKRAPKIAPDVANEISVQSGGHPFILQHILHYLFENGIETATMESVQREVFRFRDHQSACLDNWWKKIGEDGQTVYSVLRQHENWVTLDELSQEINNLDIQVDRGLKVLYYHGIVLRDNTYRKYRIGSKLFNTWSTSRCQTIIQNLEQSDPKEKLKAHITNKDSAVTRDNSFSSYISNTSFAKPIEMEHSIFEKLVEILTKHAVNSIDSPNNFFKDLINRADLPNRWKWNWADAWEKDLEANARKLINWSIAKGINPENSRPHFTIFGSILDRLLQEVGIEEARIIAGLMIGYKQCLDQQLQEDLAIRYQIPFMMELQVGPSNTNLYRAWRGPIPENDLELQRFLTHESSMLDIGFLLQAVNRATSVCRIELPQKGRQGTGFLIANNLLLTNYHIFKEDDDEVLEENISQAIFRFGCITLNRGQENEGQIFRAVAKEKESPTNDLDYLLLRVEDKIKQVKGISIAPYYLKTVNKDTNIHILQHPGGEAMKIAINDNGITGVYQNSGLLQYVTRTASGSSGAPCFNDDWEIVALHHAERSRSFGSIREGILFSAIYEQIKACLPDSYSR